MRWEISVGNAFSGSLDGRAWSCDDDICNGVRSPRRLGDVAREAGRDDGLELALDRAGVPGRDTCSSVSDIDRAKSEADSRRRRDRRRCHPLCV